MIVSKNISFKYTLLVNSDYIETQLKLLGINPVRWAVVEINPALVTVSVSFEI